MKTFISFLFVLSLLAQDSFAQDILFTKSANINFYSKTPIEDIDAATKEGISFINIPKAEINFSVLIKSFRFEKALMEEHFNENYMESAKFPKATFKGKIDNIKEINFSKDGEYSAKISGDLSIHGITKKIKSNGKIMIKSGKASANSEFKIKLADYEIKVPSVVSNKIAEEILITVKSNYEPYKK